MNTQILLRLAGRIVFVSLDSRGRAGIDVPDLSFVSIFRFDMLGTPQLARILEASAPANHPAFSIRCQLLATPCPLLFHDAGKPRAQRERCTELSESESFQFILRAPTFSPEHPNSSGRSPVICWIGRKRRASALVRPITRLCNKAAIWPDTTRWYGPPRYSCAPSFAP